MSDRAVKLRQAILDALPYGSEESVPDAVLLAVLLVLEEGETINWGIRVDLPHPRRSEKAGHVMTHFDEEISRRCREIWDGWTPVRRRRWTGPWEEVADV